jgi:hypothetical protein
MIKQPETKRDRQNKAYRKLIREISYKDAGEVFRRNMFWRTQGRVELSTII